MAKKNDPLKGLTLGELDTISRTLGEDVMQAVADGTQNRWKGLALVALTHARRTDPTAQLKTYLDMHPDQLADILYGPETDDQPDQPTGSDVEALEADPTAPAPAS